MHLRLPSAAEDTHPPKPHACFVFARGQAGSLYTLGARSELCIICFVFIILISAIKKPGLTNATVFVDIFIQQSVKDPNSNLEAASSSGKDYIVLFKYILAIRSISWDYVCLIAAVF